MRLIIASRNAGKQAEYEALLEGLALELLLPQSLGALEVDERGADYAANALLKAQAYAQAYSHWALADDTGLEVEALGGAPGLRSARLVGPGRSDAARRQRLLELLDGHPSPWRARFVCVAALVSPGGETLLGDGACAGEIIAEGRGAAGFGYDSIFLVGGVGRTMAELGMVEKNLISHRAAAVRALIPELEQRIRLAEQ